ncbi:MAG TPA: VTT domain-containing protein [Thermoanaerobaculia bacterium]|nr:VTT domain-containing protein [Thermoanaerobaculia bacterium]
MPRAALLRFLVVPTLLLASFVALRWTPLAGYLNGPALSAAVARLRESWWAPAALIAGYLVLSPLGLPATPLMVAGGMVFGAVAGTLYNLLGVYAGGATTYFLGRLLGRELVVHVAGRRLRKVEKAVARRGFWSLVGLRFLPLPYPLINYGMALGGVRPGLFLVTTAIGLLPSVVIYTYFFAVLSRAASTQRTEILLQAAVAIGLLVLLTLTPQLYQARKRRSRYARLRVERAQRAGRGRQS